LTSYKFRVILSSWGIAIDIDADIERVAEAPVEAIMIADRFFLRLGEEVRLPAADLEAFVAGLSRIAPAVSDTLDEGAIAVVELHEVHIAHADFQTEGMEAAAIAWACDSLKIEMPRIKTSFDAGENAYMFEYE
jgi:hypothetical protein